ncbi:MAG: PKD domain-containing protein, partial [Lachnospiraceae bacterium]|nr:PKD domain-containing protein [Lachnospiraceae bacterium]
MKRNFRNKMIALALIITMLPVESVLDCIPDRVYAAEEVEEVEEPAAGQQQSSVSENGAQISQSSVSGNEISVPANGALELSGEMSDDGVIKLEWSPLGEEAAQYEIFRNDTLLSVIEIAEETETIFEDSQIVESQSYIYQVQAKNGQGEVLGVSNAVEVQVPAALVISENYTLTENLQVFSLELSSGTLNLNGYTLKVCKDYWQKSGTLNFNDGSLYCQGNFTVDGGSVLMQSVNDYLYVGGNIAWVNNGKGTAVNSGEIELKGNFKATGFYETTMGSQNKIIFCGEEKQTISMGQNGRFGCVELRNYSEEGVYSATVFAKSNLIRNHCKITYGDIVGEYGWTLQEDTVRKGDLVLVEDTLDLNGHQLIIEGDLVQVSGCVKVNGGNLIVNGDYRIQSRTGNIGSYTYGISGARLEMTNEEDTVYVEGSFLSNSSTGSQLTAGTMEVKKDFKVEGKNSFIATDKHKVVLSGEGYQELSLKESGYTGNRLADLEITNISEEGVKALSPYISGQITDHDNLIGGYIDIGKTTTFADEDFKGNIRITNGAVFKDSLIIHGDLYLYSSTVVEGELCVEGNCKQNDSLTMRNGKLVIEGDYTIFGSDGRLYMNHEEDYIHVLGNMSCHSGQACQTSAGTIEIGGNLTSYKGIHATGNHRFLFSGTGRQVISLTEDEYMAVVELKNTSAEGVYSEKLFAKTTLITNGNRITYGELQGESGWTLQGDTVYEGDLILLDGTLDLNGYQLKVTGDLVQMSGVVKPAGGELLVEGDYRLQYRESEEEGYTYKTGSGILQMTEEADHVNVSGSFIFDTSMSQKDYLTAGVLEVKQDVIINGKTFIPSGAHTLLLSGASGQTVDVKESDMTKSRIANLEIKNSSEQGVTILGEPYVLGNVDNQAILVNGAISIVGTTTFTEDHYNGSIRIAQKIVIEDTFTIDGDLIVACYLSALEISGTVNVNGNCIQTPSSQICMKKGKLIIKGDYSISRGTWFSSGILMQNPEDYVHVYGDVTYDTCGAAEMPKLCRNFQNGVFEIGGDLTSASGIYANNLHKFVFSGEEKQVIDVAEDEFFATVELKNESEEGVWAKEVLRIDRLIRNNCKIMYGTEEGIYGWRLEEDTVYEGDLILIGDTLDLNGHELVVKGDLIQFLGTVRVNGGRLTVEGDYRVQFRSQEGDSYVYGKSRGYLSMSDRSYVYVGGDFVYDSVATQCYWDGTMEVKGNVTILGSLQITGNHTLLLSGEEEQIVSIESIDRWNMSCLGNLEVQNTSGQGVTIEKNPVIRGSVTTHGNHLSGSITICETTSFEDDCYHGDVYIEARPTKLTKPLTVYGDLYIQGITTIFGNIVIKGNCIQENTLTMETGKLTIEGNYDIKDNIIRGYDSSIIMTHAEDYISVAGNVASLSQRRHQLTDGTFEVGGNLTSAGGLCATGNHRFLFSGQEKQTISIQDSECFAIVELKNYSQEGVYSEKTFAKKELIQNGCKLSLGNNAQIWDWKLTSDYVCQGDLTIGDGVVDLNGHTLTVTGDLLQSGGDIKINGGALIVNGNAQVSQFTMQNAKDTVLICGDLVMKLNHISAEEMSDGVLEVQGDLALQSAGTGGIGNTLLVFSGEDTQTWTSDTNLWVSNVVNRNKKELLITSDVVVKAIATDEEDTITGEGSIRVDDLNKLKNGSWSGSVTLTKENTLQQDLTIEGTLRINAPLYTEGYSVNSENIGINAPLYVQSAQISCMGEFSILSSGKLIMQDAEGYVFVGDDFVIYTQYDHKGLLTDGTLEIRGHFTRKNRVDFIASNNHVIILSPKMSENGRNFVQTVSSQYGITKFNKLILKKNNDRYQFYIPINRLAKEVIYDITDDTAPTGVGAITASNITVKSVTLFYGGAQDESGIAGYEIYRDNKKIGTTSALCYTDCGILPDKEYTYKVYAFDEFGNIAVDSPSCTVKTPKDIEAPAAPTGAAVYTRTGSSVTLSFNAATDNVGVEDYTIYRNGEKVATGVKNTYYKDTGLQKNTVYQYYIVANDASGNPSQESKRVEASVAMPEIMGIEPQDYSSIGGTQVTLQAVFRNVGNSTGNKVKMEYLNEAGEWSMLSPTLLGQKKWDNTSLYVDYIWDISQLSGQQEYRVRYTLYDEDGNTDVQEAVYYIDRQAPETPTGVEALSDNGTVALSWEVSSSADCTYYNLYRQEEDQQEFHLLAKVDGRYGNRYTDKTIEDGKTYIYVVTAVDKFDNESGYSVRAEAVGERDMEPPQVTGITPRAGRVNQTEPIVVTAKDNKEVSSVILRYRAEDGEEWVELGRVSAQNGQIAYGWDTTGLSDGSYIFGALAVDTSGNRSAEEFTRRYEVDNTGIAQIEITGYSVTATGVQIHWADVAESDFAYFQVEQQKGDEFVSVGTVADVLGYSVTKLSPDSEYCFRVVGYDNLGNRGVPSKVLNVITKADTTNPVITAVYPAASFYKDKIALKVRASDNDSVRNARFSYSLDKENYTELANILAYPNGRDVTFRYDFDISTLPEGPVYVKFEVYDASDLKNAPLSTGEDVVMEYRIDRTPPAKAENLTATGVDGYVGLNWKESTEEDIKAYKIYRADAKTGIFKVIEENWNALNYYDTSVTVGSSYIYKVAAVDIAGNEGECSQGIYATVLEDATIPVITGMSPADGGYAGPNTTIKVVAMDNAQLSRIRVEYRKEDSTEEIWTLLAETEANDRSFLSSVQWDTDGLEEGEYLVRATAWDWAGNASEVFQVTYSLDLTPPEAPKLTARTGHFEIDLSVAEADREDLAYYAFYRRVVGEEEYHVIRKGTEGTYTDTDVAPDTVYSYKVAAYDKCGNVSWSAEKTAHADSVDVIAPTAVLPENLLGLAGMEMAFDGMGSSDNVRITSYRWDMGNGDVLTGAQPVYTYHEPGIYTVTLEVGDAAGNTAKASAIVQIYEKSGRGITKVKVADEEGIGIPYALIYVKGANGEPLSLKADASGYVTIAEKTGAYFVAAYSKDYLPADMEIQVSQYETKEYTLTLVKDELIVGDLTVRRMSLAEMIEAGVDFSDPENYHRFVFQVKLTFAQSPIPVEIQYITGTAGIQWYGADGEPLGEGWSGGAPSKIGIQSVEIEEVEEEVPVLAYVNTVQSVSWLKEMYEVELGILNAADSKYVIEDAVATLNLPASGVSLAKTREVQNLTQEMGSIRGQERQRVSWILKGDDSGSYTVSADFEGTLMPFGTPVSAHFVTEQEFEVSTGEGLHIYVMPENRAYIGEEYYIQFKIANESERPFYNLSTSMGAYSQPDQEYTVTDLGTGEVSTETCDGFVIEDAGLVSQSVILTDGQKLTFNCLLPGQEYYGTYQTSFTGEGDPETEYYKLVDSLVTVLTGANKGVKVTVVPIGSHISRSYWGCMETPSLYGDPIDIGSGYFADEMTAFSITGATELALDIRYVSGMTENSGELGYGWYHDYEMYLEQHNGVVWFHPYPGASVSFVSCYALNRQIYTEGGSRGALSAEEKYSYGEYRCVNSDMSEYRLVRHQDGSYTLTLPDGLGYGFDRDGQLVKIREVDGKSVSLSHEEGRTVVTEDISGKKMYLNYNEAGQLVSVSDDYERQTDFAYDASNRLSTLTSPAGETISYTYDEENRITAEGNFQGIFVTNEYDEKGRVICQTDAEGGISRLSYNVAEDGMTVTIVDAADAAKQVMVDGQGRIMKVVNENGGTTEYIYDENGNVICEKDAYGSCIFREYDENGNLLSVTDKGNLTTTMTYDDRGNVASITNAGGQTAYYSYDDRGLTTQEVDYAGLATAYEYDENGLLTKQTTEGLGSIIYTYDKGMLASIRDYRGNLSYYTYDGAGNLIKIVDGAGNATAYTYDKADRMTRMVDCLGNATTYTYDGNGNVTSMTDACGNTTRYTYDRAGRQTAVIHADGTKEEYCYDAMGYLTEVIHADGTKDTYLHDASGNVVKEILADGSQISYTYDLLNQCTSETDACGNTITYQYYPNGNPYKTVYPDGTYELYTYNEKWKVSAVTDRSGSTGTYEYDAMSRLTMERDALGNACRYEYDALGRLVRETDKNGNATSYTYDANSNCVTKTNALGTTVHMEYDALNR